MDGKSNTTLEYPTDTMHDIANRHTTRCMAELGNESIKGAAGWAFGRDPEDIVREAIMASLVELANYG
jgi:hypothetical protein